MIAKGTDTLGPLTLEYSPGYLPVVYQYQGCQTGGVLCKLGFTVP